MLDGIICPLCEARLEIEDTETVCYDPIVSLEVVSYRCPACGYRKSTELMKLAN